MSGNLETAMKDAILATGIMLGRDETVPSIVECAETLAKACVQVVERWSGEEPE